MNLNLDLDNNEHVKLLETIANLFGIEQVIKNVNGENDDEIYGLMQYEKYIKSLLNLVRTEEINKLNRDACLAYENMLLALSDAHHPLVIEIIYPIGDIYKEYLEQIVPVLGDRIVFNFARSTREFVICYNEVTAKTLRKWLYKAYRELITKITLKFKELDFGFDHIKNDAERENHYFNNSIISRLLFHHLPKYKYNRLIQPLTYEKAREILGHSSLNNYMENNLTAQQRANCQFYIDYYIERGANNRLGANNSICLKGYVSIMGLNLDYQFDFKQVKEIIKFNIPEMI